MYSVAARTSARISATKRAPSSRNAAWEPRKKPAPASSSPMIRVEALTSGRSSPSDSGVPPPPARSFRSASRPSTADVRSRYASSIDALSTTTASNLQSTSMTSIDAVLYRSRLALLVLRSPAVEPPTVSTWTHTRSGHSRLASSTRAPRRTPAARAG